MSSSRLMELFHFTQADLDANRSGMLSPGQEARLADIRRKIRRLRTVSGLVLTAAGGAGLWWVASLFARGEGDLPSWIAGGCIFALTAAAGAAALFGGLRPAARPTVAAARGRARVMRVQRSVRTGSSTSHTVSTELHLDDRRWVIPDAALTELEDGVNYAVYFWEQRGDILSLEKSGGGEA